MTQEEKQLLLTDLCARSPYGVKVSITAHNLDYEEDFGKTIIAELMGIHTAKDDDGITHTCFVTCYDKYKTQGNDIETIKPYLRRMSSMTEEEKEELKSKCLHTETEEDWEGVRCDVWGILILDKYDTRRWDNPIWPSTINMDAIDWLNAHHFDYRGLIPKGFAIAVTKENNPYEI